MSAGKVVRRVSPEVDKLVRELAKEQNITADAATEKLIQAGFKRRRALATYAAKKKG